MGEIKKEMNGYTNTFTDIYEERDNMNNYS